MKHAYVFPGQGSQRIGMGKELADNFPQAREVFEIVDDALSQNLSKIIFEGSEEDLNLTQNTQPALMAVSMAVVRVIDAQLEGFIEKNGAFVAGHSLGEYSALTAAGVLKIEDTARLLRLRGQSMQKAVPVGIGAMAAILGLEFDAVKEIADQAAGSDVCDVANDNSNGQVVISGHKQAVERAIEIAAQRGAKRAIMLPVSAPFHCKLMAPAADAMKEALKEVEFQKPVIPVVTNMTAQAESDPHELKKLLVEQITGMVRWRESVQWMASRGVSSMVELGSGRVLCGLARRIDRNISCSGVESPQEIDDIVEKITNAADL